jgi:hypothetical protein
MHTTAQPPSTLWLVFYKIDGQWQRDGEWFDRAGAYSQGRENQKAFGWDFCVVPVPLPEAVRVKTRGQEWRKAGK